MNKPDGKLGILIAGLGSVSSTFIVGVEAAKLGLGVPYGSLTQQGRFPSNNSKPGSPIKERLSLAELADLKFLTWDIFEDNCYQAAIKSGVINKDLLDKIKPNLEAIIPKKAVFDQKYVKRLSGTYVKDGANWKENAEYLKKDILDFQKKNGVTRSVFIWCASTEIFIEQKKVHQTLADFEKGLQDNDPDISPSQVYAYAALSLGIPFINGAPNLTAEIPALLELAKKNKVCVAGKDLKTGQTLLKTIIAPGLKTRLLGINGWFSSNILGNRDGEVLDDPQSFKTKEESKLSVLESILQPEVYPELYGKLYHKVRINYYPPAGDNKEAWDNIDIFGWLGYPMQIKINFLCRDSILAAPIVLDTALFIDLAQRSGKYGVQEWLSFYFKSPMKADGFASDNDLFSQHQKLFKELENIASQQA